MFKGKVYETQLRLASKLSRTMLAWFARESIVIHFVLLPFVTPQSDFKSCQAQSKEGELKSLVKIDLLFEDFGPKPKLDISESMYNKYYTANNYQTRDPSPLRPVTP